MSFSWKNLPKPVVGLSAMDGVTDAAMRHITMFYGKPDFLVTEFTSADGIVHGVTKLLRDFYYTDIQRPIIAQIFGSNPNTFYTCSVICCYLGFDGIDINMGCPADSVAKKGGGASLIRTPELAKAIITAVQQGIADWVNGKTMKELGLPDPFVRALEKRIKGKESRDRLALPVSVKTRVGFDKPVTVEWTKHLLETNPAVITFHGRTLEQQYSGQANWEEIAKAVEAAKESNTLIFGNGDLTTPELIVSRIQESSVDGVWIGRIAMGNPWIFEQFRTYVATGTYSEPTKKQRFSTALEHCRKFEELNATEFAEDPYPFLHMRKHFGWYVKGFPNAGELRAKLFQTNSSDEVKAIFSRANGL